MVVDMIAFLSNAPAKLRRASAAARPPPTSRAPPASAGCSPTWLGGPLTYSPVGHPAADAMPQIVAWIANNGTYQDTRATLVVRSPRLRTCDHPANTAPSNA